MVSGGDLEKNFIELAIFYLKDKVSKEDIRYLLKLRDHIFDIQTIISKNLIQIKDLKLKLNSNKSLNKLRNIYPELITFKRISKKDSATINYLLDEVVYGGQWDHNKIQETIQYCFEDIYEDFEMYKFYESNYQHLKEQDLKEEEIA